MDLILSTENQILKFLLILLMNSLQQHKIRPATFRFLQCLRKILKIEKINLSLIFFNMIKKYN